MPPAVRVEDDGAVRSVVLCRPDEYNTITPELRDELGAAVDTAGRDLWVRVVLLRAEGPAFCAGCGLDWSTAAQASAVADAGARHTPEGAAFMQRAQEVGFREAVRERDRPFADYGERPR